jgi:amidohydrolase
MNTRDIEHGEWIDALEQETASIAAELTALRRHLHQYPELSMHEFHTTDYIARLISEQGIAFSKTRSGVGLSCDLECATDGYDGPKIGIRGDIDALPIATMSTRDYASKHKGVMHACGHDAHTTMAYGATVLIHRMAKKKLLPWNVRVRTIFQPAEETAQGGLLVIEEGMLRGLTCVFALHVEPSLTVGEVATRPGAITAGCAAFEIKISGSTGHSARPYLAVDALSAGVQFVNQVYALVPRSYDCRDSAVVSFGTFHAGTAANVITDVAALSGTLRTLSEETKQAILNKMLTIAQSVMMATGVKVDIRITNDTPTLKNDPELALEMLSLSRRLPRVQEVIELPLPSMGAEDFAFIATKVPACLMRLGTGGRDGKNTFPLHSTKFDIEEESLCIGAQVLAASAIFACRSR